MLLLLLLLLQFIATVICSLCGLTGLFQRGTCIWLSISRPTINCSGQNVRDHELLEFPCVLLDERGQEIASFQKFILPKSSFLKSYFFYFSFITIRQRCRRTANGTIEFSGAWTKRCMVVWLDENKMLTNKLKTRCFFFFSFFYRILISVVDFVDQAT